MKKRINLLSPKKKVNYLLLYRDKIRLFASLVGVLCFILFIFFITILLKVKNNINAMNLKKKSYLTYLVENKEAEANVRYLKIKQDQLTNFMKDDAHFLPYYTILKESINTSTQSALLNSISINKSRETTFTVQFLKYENVISFIKYVESDDFLSKFSQLTLSSFALNVKTAIGNSYKYQLQFKGKFNQINE